MSFKLYFILISYIFNFNKLHFSSTNSIKLNITKN